MIGDVFFPASGTARAFEEFREAYYERTLGMLREFTPIEVQHALAGESDNYSFPAAGERAWCPEIGNLRSLLVQPSAAASNAAAQLVLWGAQSGRSCGISLSTRPDQVIYFSIYRVRVGHRTRFAAAKDTMTVETDGRTTSFCRFGRKWLRDAEATQAVAWHDDPAIVFASDQFVDPELGAPIDESLSPEGFAEGVGTCVHALTDIRQLSQEYFSWCSRVLNQVHLVGCRQRGVSLSRSALSRPGSIVMSHPAHKVQHLESLVHECTHQYFYLLSSLTPILKDPSDRRLYFSSIVLRERPLDKILLAYHATANILAFLTMAKERRPELAEMAGLRITEHTSICRQLRDVLSANAERLSSGAYEFWIRSQERVANLLEA